MRKTCMMLFLAALSGCAVMPQHGYPNAEGLQRSVASYWTGQPISAIEARYGNPTNCVSPSPLGNAQGCYWRQTAAREYRYATSSTVTGQSGDASQYPYQQPTPFTASVPDTRSEVESYECTLQVEVNAQGIVQRAGLAGKMGACAYFQP